MFIHEPIVIERQDVEQLPHGFVYVDKIDPTMQQSIRYFSNDNFTGKRIEGYIVNKIICTLQAAQQLKMVNDELKTHGYELVIYDAYRPQSSVDSFKAWKDDNTDQKAKNLYYPTINKKDVTTLGYVASRSGHSRGSTIDLTIIEIGKKVSPIKLSKRVLLNGDEIPFLDDGTVDMGSSFDLFHEASFHDTPLLDKNYIEKRNFLRNIMEKHGFIAYEKEWWHYTLKDEPFPDTYHDFIPGEKYK